MSALRILTVIALLFVWGASELAAATITATWDRNSESNIGGYILSYGTQSRTYTTSIDVGNVTTRQVVLNPGRYYFVVQAYNTSSQTSPRSAEVVFDVPSPPNITSLSPTSGSVGAAITINGANFGTTQGGSTVRFNGTIATATSWSATRIVATVPGGATTGLVTVTVAGVASSGIAFTLTGTAPSITTLSPTSGSIGTAVTISGVNFGSSQGGSEVRFNGRSATPTSWSATRIVATVPSGATSGNVVVAVGGIASNGVAFTVGSTPNITSLSPTSGSVGAAVTINGANFGSSQGTSTIRFNGTTASPTSWSATRIVASVPSGATSGNVVVTVGGVASNGASFTVLPAAGAITLVQRRSLAGSGTSAALAFASSNTAGNFIAVAVRVYGTNQTITVRDSRSNSYQQAVKFNNGINDTLGIYYAQNIGGGTNTVTVSNSTSSASVRVAILEYAGIAGSGALDVTATNTLQNATPTSGNVSTTVNGDLLLGVFSTAEPGTFTAGSGYTIRETNDAAPDSRLMVEDRIQATAGTTSATATVGASVWWGAALAAFKPASSGTSQLAALTSVEPLSARTAAPVSSPPAPPRNDDYDGDGKADVTVFTPSTGIWSIRESSTGTASTPTLGVAGDRPVPGDYDGDGKTDIAVYHPATGEWSVLLSSTGAPTVVTWGSTTDLAVPADYDGDGKTDLAIYRPSSGEWITFESSTQTTRTVVWGSSSNMPVPDDYDGDGKADLAVYRPSTGLWQVLQSGTNTPRTATWGSADDLPIPGDYDGDGQADVAVYRASTGLWSILQSSTNTVRTVTWGSLSDVPTPGDYDGDGTTDLAVFRPSTGLWQILRSSTNTSTTLTWGTSTDIPMP